MTLLELRDALQKATGPDYLIDAAILELTKGAKLEMIDGFRGIRWPDGRVEPTGYMPKFTYSIDAAVTLVPPDTDWALEVHCSEGIAATFYVGGYSDGVKASEFGSTPALALCLARIEYEIAKAKP